MPMDSMSTSNEAHRPTIESPAGALTDAGSWTVKGHLAEETRHAETEEVAKEEKTVVANMVNLHLGVTTVMPTIPGFTTLRASPMDPAAGAVEGAAQALADLGANMFSATTAGSTATSDRTAPILGGKSARIAAEPTMLMIAASSPAGSYGPDPWITK